MRSAVPIFALFVIACLELKPAGGDESGNATGAATGGDGGAAAATGVECIVEPGTGATLCTGISSCANVFVDHDAYPTCGFRPGSGVLDLECACGSSLCPVGVATTCEDAARLLVNQTQSIVCAQEYEGRCARASGTTPKKPCDEECLIRCVDDGCPKRCGCAN